MTMTANPDGELDPGANPDAGEPTGDSALDFLIQRENERDDPEQDDATPEEADDDAQASDPAAADDPDIEFELDGKPIKVKKSELPNIYRNQLLEADYRSKTAAAAELTRATAQERERVAQERSYYVNQWDTLGHAVYQELVGAQADLPRLLEEDPVAYLRVKEQIAQKEQQLQQIGAQRQQLVQQQAADQDREYNAYLQAEQQKLQEKLPEWRDAKVRDTESKAIAQYLIDAGYSQDELGTLADHRALLIARDAMRWRTQQAIRAKQAQPQPAKTAQPGARNQPSNANPRAEELRRKATRTRSTQDILAYMTSKET